MPRPSGEDCPVMVRFVPILGVLLGLVGCGEERTTHVVPVTPTNAADDAPSSRAVTRPARAIATH